MMRKVLLITCLLSLLTGITFGQDIGFTFVDEDYVSTIADAPDNFSAGSTPPFPVGLEDVTDTLSVYTVGQSAVHQVGFQLPSTFYFPHGLLRGRQVVITFPPEFDLTTISSVSYRDTDDMHSDPQIAWVFIYYHSLVVRFRDNLPSPSQPDFAYITINSIKNPTEARDFRVVVKVDNYFAQTVAGPAFSDYFELTPDSPMYLAVSPSDALTVRAGDLTPFSGEVTDKYGNLIATNDIAWSIDGELDPIGHMVESAFMATTVGTGRVRADFEELTTFSGPIRVTPGDAERLALIVVPDTIESGQSLHHDVDVSVYDGFENKKTDFTGSVWFTTDDEQAEVPYDEGNPYRFTAEDQGGRVFSGDEFIFQTAGPRVLSVLSDGYLSATAGGIFVTTEGEISFIVSAPEVVYAGDEFTIEILNAVDNYGNPFTGAISVTGGETSPNGTEPDISNIFVSSGTGSAQFTLYAAGLNDLDFRLGEFSRRQTIEVLPNSVISATVDVDQTQFVGYPFNGGLRVVFTDDFGNPQVNVGSMINAVMFWTDEGSIWPNNVSADEIEDGVLTVDSMIFDGAPGLKNLTVGLDNSSDTVVSFHTEFYANGIMLETAENYNLASEIPRGWTAGTRGYLQNPGNVTPVSLNGSAGFVSIGNTDSFEILPSDCIPEAGGVSTCQYMVELTSDFEPGDYTYRITATAEYVYNEKTILVTTFIDKIVAIIPFTEFTISDWNLPAIALQRPDTLTGGFTINNSNDFNSDTYLTYRVKLDNGYTVSIGKFRYDWSPSLPIESDFIIRPDIQIGTYAYGLDITLRMYQEDGYPLEYQMQFAPGDSLTIVPRALYLVNGDNVTPVNATVGSSVSFTVPLEIVGQSTIYLDGTQSFFTISDGQVSSQARLAEDGYTLTDGITELTTMPIAIPNNWLNKNLVGSLTIVGTESDYFEVNRTIYFGIPLNITDLPATRIVSLEIEAPNVPFVNTGQEFSLVGKIYNSSTVDVTRPFTVTANSDGGSSISDPVVVESLPAGDTAIVTFTITADENPNPAERFYLTASNLDQPLSEIDNDAIAVIQIPANLTFSAEIQDRIGPIAVLDFNEVFIITAEYDNDGQSDFTGGTLLLNYDGTENFGVEFPVSVSLGDDMAWALVSPNVAFASELTVRWGEAPIDKNTGEPVTVLSDPVTLPFKVEASITRLVIQPDSFDTQPLIRNQMSTLFKLAMENVTSDSRNIIGVKTIMIKVTDRDGNKIDGSYIVEDNGSGFYVNNELKTELIFINGELAFKFNDMFIEAGQKAVLEMRFMPKIDALLDFFNMRLDGDDITAEFVSGPRTGERVTITGVLDRAFEVSLPQAIIATEFGESFKNYPNPFNPMVEETEFIYNLPSDSDVDIYIFTATGEKVRHLHYAAGSTGGQGDQLARAYWDGRNGDGEIVLNGVYIAYIEVAQGGLKAKVKMAVVK